MTSFLQGLANKTTLSLAQSFYSSSASYTPSSSFLWPLSPSFTHSPLPSGLVPCWCCDILLARRRGSSGCYTPGCLSRTSKVTSRDTRSSLIADLRNCLSTPVRGIVYCPRAHNIQKCLRTRQYSRGRTFVDYRPTRKVSAPNVFTELDRLTSACKKPASITPVQGCN